MVTESFQHVDTVVIGGGQAGLAIGYYLAQHDHNFVIVDASERIGDTWRNRWDSLQLFTSARYNSLPGMSFPAPDDSFPTKDEMADYLEAYAARFELPVQLNTTVDTLTRNGDRYVLDTDSQPFRAEHVVVATGPFHHPKVPIFAGELDPSITQFHSSEYRNPDQLPDGDVLVVGAGNSGAEIAVDLAATDRKIWLSGRDVGHNPFPLELVANSRGIWWLVSSVLTVDTLIGRKLKERTHGRANPLVRLTPTKIRRAGVERVPRTAGIADGKPRLDGGRVLAVATVVWATGFRPEYSWIEVPGLSVDEDGYPIHHRGVVDEAPGLYFVGLPYQYTPVSATVGGVGTDTRYIANRLLAASSP